MTMILMQMNAYADHEFQLQLLHEENIEWDNKIEENWMVSFEFHIYFIPVAMLTEIEMG